MRSYEEIKKIVSEEIRKFIAEEKGIAEIVVRDTENICITIKEQLKNVSAEKYEDYILRKNSFSINIFDGFEINVKYMCYNFKSYEAYEKHMYDFNFTGASSFADRVLVLNFFAIFGEIDDRTFYDQCQHEVSHLYMAYKKKNVLFSKRRTKLYDTATTLMNSGDNGGFDNLFGTILYFSFEEEQNAYVNGLYQLMKNNFSNFNEPYNIMVQSDAYKALERLKYFKDVLSSNELDSEDIENINKSLSKTRNNNIDWYKTLLDKTIHELSKKIAKVYYKAKQEYNLYIAKYKINKQL